MLWNLSIYFLICISNLFSHKYHFLKIFIKELYHNTQTWLPILQHNFMV